MDRRDAAQALSHYVNLRWIGEQQNAFDWTSTDGGFTITPRKGSNVKQPQVFPIVLTADGKVKLPLLHIDDYPSDEARPALANLPPDGPVVFLCTRYYYNFGHTLLYLHHPGKMQEDRIVNFGWDENFWNWSGTAFTRDRVSNITDPYTGAINSFVGFRVNSRQVELIDADAQLFMANPKVGYSATNHSRDKLNCSGFTMRRLREVGVPLDMLKEGLSNKWHLWIDRPTPLHHAIHTQAQQDGSATEVTLSDPARPDAPGKSQLNLASTKSGLLIGCIEGPKGLKSTKHKYFLYQARDVMAHVLPQAVDAQQFLDLNSVRIPPLDISAVNTARWPTPGMGTPPAPDAGVSSAAALA